MVGRGSMSPEHKAKLQGARDAYWARKKAEKAAVAAALDESAPVQPSDLINNSFNGPAQNPPKEEVINQRTPGISHRERTQLRVGKKIEKILDAQIDAATGLYYVTADGKHVYKKVPETSTGQYLLNQLIGKPKESIEVKSVNLKVDI